MTLLHFHMPCCCTCHRLKSLFICFWRHLSSDFRAEPKSLMFRWQLWSICERAEWYCYVVCRCSIGCMWQLSNICCQTRPTNHRFHSICLKQECVRLQLGHLRLAMKGEKENQTRNFICLLFYVLHYKLNLLCRHVLFMYNCDMYRCRQCNSWFWLRLWSQLNLTCGLTL